MVAAELHRARRVAATTRLASASRSKQNANHGIHQGRPRRSTCASSGSNAQLSLRQLADAAGVSNPYLSQIERGCASRARRCCSSRQGAADLRRGAVRAGRHPRRARERPGDSWPRSSPTRLNERQKQVLLDIYESFRAENARSVAKADEITGAERPAGKQPVRQRAAKKAAAKTAKKAAAKATKSAKSAGRTSTPTASHDANLRARHRQPDHEHPTDEERLMSVMTDLREERHEEHPGLRGGRCHRPGREGARGAGPRDQGPSRTGAACRQGAHE